MSERQYLVARAAQERKFASGATDPRAAVIHSAMAAEYERRLLDLETAQQFKRLVSWRRTQQSRLKLSDQSASEAG